VRPGLEQLEDRLTPSNFTAANVSDLVADINAANLAAGSNTIALTASTSSPYVLTAVDNTTDGATGLPVIAAKDKLTIVGNGDTIERNTASGTPSFRLLDVANRASLTLNNLTLQGGLAFGSGVSAEGGGIYNNGTLVLNGVNVQNNIAQGQNGVNGTVYAHSGSAGSSAAGGGVYSSGLLTLEGGTSVQNNQALGGKGGLEGYRSTAGGSGSLSLPGGNAMGGGVYVAGGSAMLTAVSVSSNTAEGGQAGYSLYTHIVRPGVAGLGEGGGLYIAPAATVNLDAYTLANIIKQYRFHQ